MTGTATQIAQRVLAGTSAPIEPVEEALRRIEEHRELRAFITVCAEHALERARGELEGPLAGVPLLVKDSFDTAGIRTTVGSKVYADRVPTTSAPTVLALEAAGAVVIGKTNCDEFQWGVTGQNQFYGDVRNPTLPGCITGGSSSGNAAALAAGIAPLAVGTDTGGSVRMPAGCCAVVGMKPRLGAVSTDGVFPLCPSFDSVGPMARTVEDCALGYSVLSGAQVGDQEVAGLRVGVLTAMPALGPDAPAPARDERALAFATQLEELGMHAQEIALPVPEADLWPVFYAEAAATHRETFPSRREDYGDTLRAKLDAAQDVDAEALDAGRRALARWRERAETDTEVDVVVCPTLGVHEIPHSDVDELEIRVTFSAYTRAFSFLGWPAIAIGGVQFGAYSLATVFAVALAWERAYGPPT
ncbi:MAG: amidase [Solirubrobacterales bacterium]|nr:amidase [Solirubrobacterales bacterium]MBV9917104.1 amidase [Solirubrobacterales bacterium]